MLANQLRLFLISIGLLGWPLWATSACAQDPAVFRWQRSIQVPDGDQTRLVSLPLDPQFFETTRNGWPDVRVRNDEHQSMAFVIQPAKEPKSRTIRHHWEAKTLKAHVDDVTGLQIEFSLQQDDPVPDGISIVTGLKDFEHQVRVESSADAVMWTPLGTASLIFDYSRYVDARNVLIPFDRTSHRHFRLTIEDVTAEQETQLLELNRRLRGSREVDRMETTIVNRRPFRVDGINFYRDETKFESGLLQTTTYSPTCMSVSDDNKTQQTIVLIGNQRQPIAEIQLVTKAENFSRAVTIEAQLEDSNGHQNWQPVGAGTVSRFAIGAIQREQLSIPFRETQTSQFRLTIENKDSPPLPISAVELKGSRYELIVIASPKQKLTLEYGSHEAQPGRYDDAALRAALSQGESAVGVIASTPVENQSAAGQKTEGWRPWNDNRILFAGIILLTCLLGWGLFHAGHRIESAPPE